MSQFITTAFVKQFTDNVRLLSQQMMSRLRTAVEEDSYTGEAGQAVQQIGSVNPVRRTTRHADTPLIDTPHSARWVEPVDYEYGDLIDKQDRARTLIDPTNPYARTAAAAMARAVDDEIITAALGTAKTGKAGTTSVAFGADGGQTTTTVSGGMSVQKLAEAKELLDAAEVDESVPRYVVMAARQFRELLTSGTAPNISSADYNAVRALVRGEIDTYLGFTFIRSQRLDLSGSDRQCFAWAQTGLHLGVWIDVMGRVSERDDKSYATQVYAATTIGATRTEGSQVVLIPCDES